jgi:glutathione S-transferase
MKIIGSFVSPYVRKVLACLNRKGISYEVDPITPFFGNEEFGRLSPLRRIPVLVDRNLAISDSSIICAYLDEAFGGPALLPPDPRERARARWLEEYADTRLGDLFIWSLFYQRVVRKAVWDEDPDEERIGKTLSVDVPPALDYLESEVPPSGFLFGDIGLADISVATFFRNAAYAGFTVDPARWPNLARFVDRVLADECIASLLPFEDVQRSADIRHRRQALLDAGAPLTAETFGTREARRGLMRL